MLKVVQRRQVMNAKPSFRPLARIPARCATSAKGTLVTGLALALTLVLVAAMSFQPTPGAVHAQGPAQEAVSPDRLAPEALILAGHALTYQGYLTDGGSPANGIYDFSFSLYADAAGTQWVADASVIQDKLVVDGLFTVAPDFGVPGMGDIHFYFNGEARYLRIGVRPGASIGAFTHLIPLQPLTPAPYAQALPGLHTIQNDTSPSVVGGHPWNSVGLGVVGATISGGGQAAQYNSVFADYGTVGGGRLNTVTVDGDDATVGGGASNTAGAGDATVGGGEGNTAGDLCAVVAGGCGNVADHVLATVGGGDVNYATGERSTISGGSGNSAYGLASTIGGGSTNEAGAGYATVGGGDHNEVTAVYGTIGGGGGATAADGNRVTDPYGTVGGGYQNHAGNANLNTTDAHYATVGGGYSNDASNVYATVGGGEWNESTGIFSTIGGGQANKAPGPVATVGGGGLNEATGQNATVAGGAVCTAGAAYAAVGGGHHNEVTGDYGTIAGGGGAAAASGNLVSGDYGSVGGGTNNTASGSYATVSGGNGNEAGASYATVSGGDGNEADGSYATVAGGYHSTAAGILSFAAGRQAKASYSGCFVWGDNSTTADIGCYGVNRTLFRSTGGFYIRTSNASPPSGLYLAGGGSAWNTFSSREAKENLQAVDGQSLLARLARIPITTWNYKSQDPSIRHVGPMAQDFNALLAGLGGEGEDYINTLDADGVALAAIQGLHQLSQEQATRIEELETQNAGLAARLTALEQRAASSSSHPFKQLGGWWLLGGLVLVAGVVVQRHKAGGAR
jgi:hypothetical protein